MSSLKTWERFQDARLLYNQHGKQTLRQVMDATGIQKSMISALERDTSDSNKQGRNVGYKDVAQLAEYYGVSVDWLLGLSNEPKLIPRELDVLGISEHSAEILTNYYIHKNIGRFFHKLVDELIEIADKEDDIFSSYVVMQSVASRKQTFDKSNYIEDMTQLEFLCDRLGQINLSREEFMEYYITKISDRIKRGLIRKYVSRIEEFSDNNSNND